MHVVPRAGAGESDRTLDACRQGVAGDLPERMDAGAGEDDVREHLLGHVATGRRLGQPERDDATAPGRPPPATAWSRGHRHGVRAIGREGRDPVGERLLRASLAGDEKKSAGGLRGVSAGGLRGISAGGLRGQRRLVGGTHAPRVCRREHDQAKDPGNRGPVNAGPTCDRAKIRPARAPKGPGRPFSSDRWSPRCLTTIRG